MELIELKALCQQAINYQKDVRAKKIELERVEKMLRKLEQETIPDLMLDAGLQEFTMDGVHFRLKKDYRAYFTEDKAEAALKYLISQGHGSLIRASVKTDFDPTDSDEIESMLDYLNQRGIAHELKNTIPWNTLSKFVREQDEGGTLTDEMRDLLSVSELYSVTSKTEK